MNKETLKQVAQKLKERKKDLERELSGFATKDPGVPGDWDTKFPRTPEGGLEEAAGEVEEYSTKLHIEFSLEQQLKEVNEALGRIAQGTYGTCENCKKEIAQERLVVSPEARLCLDCAGKQ